MLYMIFRMAGTGSYPADINRFESNTRKLIKYTVGTASVDT